MKVLFRFKHGSKFRFRHLQYIGGITSHDKTLRYTYKALCAPRCCIFNQF